MSESNSEEREVIEPISGKMLDRIQALLAMGKDTSSEHEAAIAMKRARSLMDKYQLDMSDFENSNHIEPDFDYTEYDTGGSRRKGWVGELAVAVAELNDCILSFNRDYAKKGRVFYIYEGFKEDVKLCRWMLNYLVETCEHLYEMNKDYLDLYGLAQKNDFINGLSGGLVTRMERIIRSRKETKKERAKEDEDDDHLNAKRARIGYKKEALGYEKSESRELIPLQRALILAKKALVVAEFGEPEYTETHTRCDEDDNAYMAGSLLAHQVHLGRFLTHEKSEASESDAEAIKTFIRNKK